MPTTRAVSSIQSMLVRLESFPPNNESGLCTTVSHRLNTKQTAITARTKPELPVTISLPPSVPPCLPLLNPPVNPPPAHRVIDHALTIAVRARSTTSSASTERAVTSGPSFSVRPSGTATTSAWTRRCGCRVEGVAKNRLRKRGQIKVYLVRHGSFFHRLMVLYGPSQLREM